MEHLLKVPGSSLVLPIPREDGHAPVGLVIEMSKQLATSYAMAGDISGVS